MASYLYVSDNRSLHECAEVLSGVRCFGLDTESDSFYSYRERVCLVQITPEGHGDYIIDPLVEDLDMDILSPIFANPDIEAIMHGADYDIVSLKRDFGYEFASIFDTMLAAQMSGFERFGLADLVKGHYDVVLDKRYQRFDWGKRPLPKEALDYAHLDSHFLPELRDILWKRAAETGRQSALEEEFELLQGREWNGRANDPAAYLRIKGAGSLDEPNQRVLRALVEAREKMAEGLDRPPFKVLPQSFLLDLARNPTTDPVRIRRIAGRHARMAQRFSRRLIAAVREGREDTGPLPVKAPSRHGPRLWPNEERRFNQLKEWRNRRAEEQDLQPALVMPNSVLKALAQAAPRSFVDLAEVEELRRWQRDEYGRELVEVIAHILEREQKQEDQAPDNEGSRRGRRRRGRKKKE